MVKVKMSACRLYLACFCKSSLCLYQESSYRHPYFSPLMLKSFRNYVFCIYDTFDNNFGIKNDITKISEVEFLVENRNISS